MNNAYKERLKRLINETDRITENLHLLKDDIKALHDLVNTCDPQDTIEIFGLYDYYACIQEVIGVLDEACDDAATLL